MRLWSVAVSGVSRVSISSPAIIRSPAILALRRRALSSEASPSQPPPPPDNAPTKADPALVKIVDQISKLSLLQAADLVSLLKTRLNIQEIAMPSAAVAAPAAALVDEPPEEEAKPKEKTIFNVKIESIDPAAKPKIIREVKAQVANLNLMEAKKFVESLPKVIKESLPKDEAEKLKATFEALGAKVVLE